MAFEAVQERIPAFTASADLSTKQFCFVKISGNRTVTACSAATDKPFGILQNHPPQGRAATIAVAGTSKVVVGAVVAAGDTIGTDANGKAATYLAANGTNYQVGQVVVPNSAANGVATVSFDCRNLRSLT